jgi:predicted dehydrogenase
MLRAIVVGTGALGRHHARILASLPNVRLAACVDPLEERGRSVAESCGSQWRARIDDVADPFDAAVVAVPTSVHLKVAAPLLKRGVAVLVEKPLAASLDDAACLVELADEHDAVLQVGHVEQFNPAFIVARKQIAEPRYIRAERYSPFAFRSMDIGVVHDVMIHDIELVLSLVKSEPVSVTAFGASLLGDREDCVSARITFANGCLADISANRVSPVTNRTLQAWTADGCTLVDFAGRKVTSFRRSEALRHGPSLIARANAPGADVERMKAELFGRWICVDTPEVPAGDALTAELQEFVAAAERTLVPRVDGRSALRALQVADRILNAVATHAWDGHAAGRIGPHADIPGAAWRSAA